jgi:hypothetical protein
MTAADWIYLLMGIVICCFVIAAIHVYFEQKAVRKQPREWRKSDNKFDDKN